MRIVLDDLWEFSSGDSSRKISLPHNFPVSTKSYPNPVSEKGIYKRTLREVKDTGNKRIILKFHGIDYYARIFINSDKVVEHEGGYDVFEVDITDKLKFDGKDSLEIEVADYDITKHPEIIAGKQDWYGNATGIWQNVELWIVDRVHIKNIGVYPQKDLQTINLDVSFSDGKLYPLDIVINDRNGLPVVNRKLEPGESGIKIPNPGLWSPNSPYLYDMRVKFANEDNCDVFSTRFGMRYIESKKGKILLNGEPLYVFGALDQNFYPDTHYSLRGKNKLLSELSKAKDMGLNLLRYHVKIPDDAYLDIADELGILVWIDLPYARGLDENSREYLKFLLGNILKRYANHPSFTILSLINESWGVDLSENASGKTREWIRSFFYKAKEIDGTRVYVDNSACMGNYHVVSDIDDFHFYSSYPYHNKEWDKHIREFANGEFRTFIEKPNNDLPKIVSEFGVWGLSNPDTWEGNWSNNPVSVAGKVFPGTEPAKALQRISEFHDTHDFIYQAQLNQLMGLKYQIEKIRMAPEITGYVITEFSDIAWEANGLLDYNRAPKAFYPYIKMLNSKILGIIPNHVFLIEKEKCNNYNSELYVSNMAPEEVEANILVRTYQRRLMETREKLRPFSIQKIGNLKGEILPEDRSVFVEIFKEGRLVSRNFYPVLVFQKKDDYPEVEDRNFDFSQQSPDTTKIVWLKNKRFQFGNFKVIAESDKIHPKIDWRCDWISGFTVFNSPRNVNLPAILGGLDELLTDLIIVPRDPQKTFSSVNSLISKVIGWGYYAGSLLYVNEEADGRFVFTTLRESELSKKLISMLLK